MSSANFDVMGAFRAAGELFAQKRFEAAAQAWDKVLSELPQSAEAHCNLGRALTELGRFDAAETALRQALTLKPGAGWALHSLAVLHQLSGRGSVAEDLYRQAIAADPTDLRAQLDLGYLYLERGDFARGWPLYELRKDVPGQHATRLDLPEWQGEPLVGKALLVWREQGFGDQIQFARFMPVLKAMGAEVSMVCAPELASLFQDLGVVIHPFSDELTLPAPDYWTLPLSVPHRLGVTAQNLPQPPYLAAPADRRARWAGFAPPGSVGVVWRGSSTHGNDHHRSLPSRDLLAPLEAVGAPLLDLQAPLGDFADLAAVVEQLDLVVTVDTAMAHLAGALGKECWVMLPWFRTDWRWLTEGTTTPWYPSVRLFRQPSMGDWASVVADVARAYVERRGD